MAVVGVSQAAITVDGLVDADYGAPLWTSQNTTSTMPGSSLTGAYAKIDSGTLYVLFTGQVASGVSFDFFVDDSTGGQQQLLPIGADKGNFNRLARDPGQSGGGLLFDQSFKAGYYTVFKQFGTDAYLDFVNVHTGAGGNTGHLQSSVAKPQLYTYKESYDPNPIVPNAAFDNSGGANTGFEIAMPLAGLVADPGAVSQLKVAAFIASGSNDSVSNQFIGLPGGYTGGVFNTNGVPGDPRWQFKMDDNAAGGGAIPGDQFIAVSVPEPATLSLALMSLALASRRRR